MQYLDQNQYARRIQLVRSILAQRPKLLSELSDTDRQQLRDYYFAGKNISGVDLTEYRTRQLKRGTTIELEAEQAYERLMAAAGLPENLPLR